VPRFGDRHPAPIPGDPRDPEGLSALLSAFLSHLAVTGAPERSVASRRITLSAFLRWCHDRDLPRAGQITRPILQAYQRHLFHYRKENGEPISLRSQTARLQAVRAFFRWLCRESYLLGNPASELTLPRAGFHLPRAVLTLEEAEAVLALPDLTTPLGLRDRALLELLFATGIRRAELSRLTLSDLDLKGGTLLVRQGKGGKDRIVPTGERAALFVSAYLTKARPELVVPPDDGMLLLTATGHPFSPDVLTNLCRGYVEKAEIGKKGACHLFRHTMATLMLEGGADVRFIQQMLGHARLDTTALYTNVSIRKLKEIHQATHPGARLETRAAAPEDEGGEP
jgi:integrase/recombinase XerD